MVKPLTYHKPRSIEEALRILDDSGAEARILAGGQDIVPVMNQGRFAPCSLVDVRELTAVNGVRSQNGSMIIGALTTHRNIERSELIRARCGLLADAAGGRGQLSDLRAGEIEAVQRAAPGEGAAHQHRATVGVPAAGQLPGQVDRQLVLLTRGDIPDEKLGPPVTLVLDEKTRVRRCRGPAQWHQRLARIELLGR